MSATNRNQLFTMRMTPEEMGQLKELAELRGLDRSAFVRMLLNNELRRVEMPHTIMSIVGENKPLGLRLMALLEENAKKALSKDLDDIAALVGKEERKRGQ